MNFAIKFPVATVTGYGRAILMNVVASNDALDSDVVQGHFRLENGEMVTISLAFGTLKSIQVNGPFVTLNEVSSVTINVEPAASTRPEVDF